MDREEKLATGYPVTVIMTTSFIGDAMKNRGLKVYVIAALVQSLLVVKEQGDRHFPHKACICALYPYDATVCFFLKRVTDRYLLFFFTAVPVTPHMEEVQTDETVFLRAGEVLSGLPQKAVETCII